MKGVRGRENRCPIKELTNSQKVTECGKLLTDRERMYTVDNYTTIESDKTRRITRLLLSNRKNKSLDLTIIGSINTPIATTTKDLILHI